MGGLIERLLNRYEAGGLTRRELVQGLTALGLGTAGGAARAQSTPSTFRAAGLNHSALDVTDIPRARDFYVRHLGLEVTSESARSCFLRCGEGDFVALFRADKSGLSHYCYSIPGYTVEKAAEALRAVGIEPRVRGQRIYFDDADGLEVQLAAP